MLELGYVGNLQFGEFNGANPPRIDNTKALWISLSVTRRGHGAVAREYAGQPSVNVVLFFFDGSRRYYNIM